MEKISLLENHLSKFWNSQIKIQDWYQLSGGACQDNFSLTIQREGKVEGFVLRTDKGGSLLSSLSKKDEFKVSQLAYAAGVKTPKPILLEEDTNIFGAPFFLMEKISGKATGRYITKDKELDVYRKTMMVSDLATNLAKMHTILPNSIEDEELKFKLRERSPQTYISDCISELRQSLDDLPEAHPSIELCLHWMFINAPRVDELVLVHGDFRTGNFMITPEGLQGILDYEFAHFGDRHEDIAWLCMRDWRFGKNNKEVGGFGDRKDFYSAYEQASGIVIDTFKVGFWELMGNIRWAIGSAQQAERHLSGKDKGIELAAIGRRTAEMEWEAMRLVEELENAI